MGNSIYVKKVILIPSKVAHKIIASIYYFDYNMKHLTYVLKRKEKWKIYLNKYLLSLKTICLYRPTPVLQFRNLHFQFDGILISVI